MKLEQSFTVAAPVEQVWEALVDVERVAPCLPGAQITGRDGEGNYQGTFSVKLGPTTAAYNGTLRMEGLDEASRTATMAAKGTDRRGQGGASATIVSTMRQTGEETTVDVSTDFHITGRLARFGRSGMIEDISRRLMRDFADCLQSSLQVEPALEAAAAGGAEAAGGPEAAAPGAPAQAPLRGPAEPTPAEAAGAPEPPPPAAPAPAQRAAEAADAAVASAGGAAPR